MLSDSFATQAGFWLGVAGLALGAVGITIAWWQLRKTRSAVEAASAAASRFRAGSDRNELLVLLARLIAIEEDLRQRVAASDEAGATGALRHWRLSAAEVRTIAGRTRPAWIGLAQLLDETIEQASTLRSARRPGANTQARYAEALASIQRATTEISGRVPELKAYTEGSDGNAS